MSPRARPLNWLLFSPSTAHSILAHIKSSRNQIPLDLARVQTRKWHKLHMGDEGSRIESLNHIIVPLLRILLRLLFESFEFSGDIVSIERAKAGLPTHKHALKRSVHPFASNGSCAIKAIHGSSQVNIDKAIGTAIELACAFLLPAGYVGGAEGNAHTSGWRKQAMLKPSRGSLHAIASNIMSQNDEKELELTPIRPADTPLAARPRVNQPGKGQCPVYIEQIARSAHIGNIVYMQFNRMLELAKSSRIDSSKMATSWEGHVQEGKYWGRDFVPMFAELFFGQAGLSESISEDRGVGRELLP
ncbi:hypothetical protein K438DRAFT_1785754 [Mycena galopus ATCC 62051]|nr:hypothetical protein K438DRAFT_1785754 [Mycena galopus ATCC 62051]